MSTRVQIVLLVSTRFRSTRNSSEPKSHQSSSTMHGRARSAAKQQARDPKIQASLEKQRQQWHIVSQQARLQKSLPLTAKLLQIHPEPLDLWNIRKSSPDIETELQLTQQALTCNPKSYGAWLHRKQCVQSVAPELALTQQLLARDERNFHGWNYRRHLVSMRMQGKDNDAWPQTTDQVRKQLDGIGLPAQEKASVDEILQDEWDFCTTKIQENFSNGSAFHHRSLLLEWKLKQEPSVLDSEWELVLNAIFTEPDDQTAWWYALTVLKPRTADTSSFVEQIQELQQEMPDSKWILLGLYELTQDTKWLDELIRVDTDRKGRYEYLKSRGTLRNLLTPSTAPASVHE